jgi:hypothetical protein
MMGTGTNEKIRLKKVVRSQKTGMLLPKEGILVCVTENLGRRLLLVVFDNGNREYLFDNEVEYDKPDLQLEDYE